ncbi:hypothetical protein [Fastidiosibacter lacustris]|uniref:hypothetical protein n=1 Tax=Fastidiosibacter lacustris TaxID=2056695 RepID=UPI000E347FAF|nr:hypothetical protein [Fastidiosibacter lacustris]
MKEKNNNLQKIEQFRLDELINEILMTFSCCGVDYALVNQSFTWCTPLHAHRYIYRFYGNKNQYCYQDPYHNYNLIGLLPRFCHLSEIAVHAKAWQELFTPEHSKYGDCYAVSYYFWGDTNIHRFVLYFDNIHNITTLYLRFIDLYHTLNKLVSHIAPLVTKFFDEFVIYPEQLSSLALPPHWLRAHKHKNIQVEFNLSDKEMHFFTLLGQGITERNELAQHMNASTRTVDNYIQKLKQLFRLTDSYELFEYIKRYWLLE